MPQTQTSTPTPTRQRPTLQYYPISQPTQSTLYAEWSDQYLDYNGLKRDLKDNAGNGPQGMRRWTEGDEAAFVKRLEKELLKCERFQVGKVSVVRAPMGGRLRWRLRDRDRD
jgi:hypothetical protein